VTSLGRRIGGMAFILAYIMFVLPIGGHALLTNHITKMMQPAPAHLVSVMGGQLLDVVTARHEKNPKMVSEKIFKLGLDNLRNVLIKETSEHDIHRGG
jgi:hypothetical protein